MNLTTKYLGLPLRTPLVVSASPLSEDISNIRKMEEFGASAVVLNSLFEEQIRQEQIELFYHTVEGTYSNPEALTYFPEPEDYRVGPEGYLEHIRKAKEAVSIPVIASLNGTSVGGWTEYARKMQEAGADAIELNIYYIPTDFDLTGNAVETTYLDILRLVKSIVTIPVAVKLSPFFSNIASMAKKLSEAGADGLVLFNRFYQPDIDLDDLEIRPVLKLSQSKEALLPMRWIAILKDRIKSDLAATTGIHTGEDVAKMLLAGANVTMLCSALLENGIEHIKTVEDELVTWLQKNEFDSVARIQGSLSQARIADPTAYERAQYMKVIKSYKL